MTKDKTRNRETFFKDGPISPDKIADSIRRHSHKKDIGAHDIFMGQVREDAIDGKTVKAIEYSAYEDMAIAELERIREEIIVKYKLKCAHILHSIGRVEAGELCLFVFVSSGHRQAAFVACQEMVERIKKEVPIFGKEIFEDGAYTWKENRFEI